jgi:hypothetical protein
VCRFLMQNFLKRFCTMQQELLLFKGSGSKEEFEEVGIHSSNSL